MIGDIERLRDALLEEIHHAEDNGHVLDRDCQGVAPGEKIPAVRTSSILAALGAFGLIEDES